jgi:hypothetical protein
MSQNDDWDIDRDHGRQAKYSYDVAQVCHNGHLANSRSKKVPTRNSAFCPQCGAATTQACLSCHAEIRGAYLPESYAVSRAPKCTVPPYCHQCGQPYPWTEAALAALGELLTEVQGMSPADREAAIALVPDLQSETPRSALAVVRWNGILGKATGAIKSGIGKLVADVAAEAVKKLLFP